MDTSQGDNRHHSLTVEHQLGTHHSQSNHRRGTHLPVRPNGDSKYRHHHPPLEHKLGTHQCNNNHSPRQCHTQDHLSYHLPHHIQILKATHAVAGHGTRDEEER